jgi:hypothetical protein
VQTEFDFFPEFVVRIKCVGKAKIGNDDIAVSIQQQILQLQISVNDALLMQITYS